VTIEQRMLIIEKDQELLKSNLAILNKTVNRLLSESEKNAFKKARDESAFISAMIEVQENIKAQTLKLANLDSRVGRLEKRIKAA